MKKVLLLAYTNRNFGDDMFILTVCSKFPTLHFELEAPTEYKRIMSRLDNLTIITPSLKSSIISKLDTLISKLTHSNNAVLRHSILKKYSAVVYVIGALFDDDDLWEGQVERLGIEKYKSLMWKKSFYKDIPFLLLGCNMTRVNSQKYVDVTNYLFEGLTDICFRDRYSYQKFKLNNTRYAPDIVFNYPIGKNKKEDKILISVWGCLLNCDKIPQWKWAEPLWKKYEELLVKVIDCFSSLNKKIILLSLCENEGDLKACEKIAKLSGLTGKSIINYTGNIETIINEICSSSFVIGTRFHSVVLSLSAEIPVYPIVYESKTLQLLKDCDFMGLYSDITSISENDINNVTTMYGSKYIANIDNVKNRAKEQFDVFKQIVGVD